jgi:phenylalanyl-tRNA synthetase beta chain
MKLSLAWIFDHIEKPHDVVTIEDVVTALNESTAEVERWSLIKPDLSQLVLAQVTAISTDAVEVYVPELSISAHLSHRSDVLDGHYALIRMGTGTEGAAWARMSDFGGTKESLLPLVHVHEGISPRNWRQSVEGEDYLIEIDNKSITHRPDLWSHRGFARELAVIRGWRLKPLEDMLAPVDIQEFTGFASTVTKTMPTLTIHDKSGCRRLAAVFVSTVAWSPSRIPMMARLCRIDSKSVNALVDFTNYVMFDIGQPMHAFDAAHIRDNQLSVRKARVGETLRLLDGDVITLTATDLIVADSTQPVSLAGIMGGSASSVKPETMTLLLESGCFDPVTIRHAVIKHKKRTDASMRFEKDLDPNQVTTALRRYLYLLHEQDVAHTHDALVVVVGPKPETVTIEVCHDFLEQRLGTIIEPSFVINALEGLGFDVAVKEATKYVCYTLMVPSYRATKDVRTPEDIVEEIGRLWGYKNITTQIPLRIAVPAELAWVYRQRTIKKIIQLRLRMHEVYTYAFFDETWLRYIEWQPTDAVEAQQPVSGNWTRLVTSLTPNLLKAVHDNVEHHTSLRFFESARIWSKKQAVTEIAMLAGILYDAQSLCDFYAYKAELESFFAYARLSVTWKPADQHIQPWFMPDQTAQLVCDGTVIGMFGMINEAWRAKIALHGSLAVFELDSLFLNSHKIATRYVQLPKYPDIRRDISLFVPLRMTADHLKEGIEKVDTRITAVTLVDFFQKNEWHDKKSLTFSFIIRDLHKTLTGHEADAVCAAVTSAVQSLGAEVR